MDKQTINILGKRFGKLTVIEYYGPHPSSHNTQWKCKCDCGNTIIAVGTYLRSGKQKNCGCVRLIRNCKVPNINTPISLENQSFGNLIVLESSENLHLCKCVCGNKRQFTTNQLIIDNNISCGCLPLKRQKNKDKNYLIGIKIHDLTIIEVGFKKHKANACKVRCKCGKEKILVISRIINENVFSCGCHTINVIKSKIGSDHHNWKNNKSNEQRELDKKYRRDHDHNVKLWTAAILKKYNYTCQKCNKKGGKIQAHHIDGWAKFPEKRYDLDNGICLCKSCHDLFHKTICKTSYKDIFIKWLNNE